MTQNNLGNALQRLGERESGTATLEKAVEAYGEALKERTRPIGRTPRSRISTEQTCCWHNDVAAIEV
jgi:hypothetical protein